MIERLFEALFSLAVLAGVAVAFRLLFNLLTQHANSLFRLARMTAP